MLLGFLQNQEPVQTGYHTSTVQSPDLQFKSCKQLSTEATREKFKCSFCFWVLRSSSQPPTSFRSSKILIGQTHDFYFSNKEVAQEARQKGTKTVLHEFVNQEFSIAHAHCLTRAKASLSKIPIPPKPTLDLNYSHEILIK